ncbi:ribosome small subunit-dependent GTPase A [Domibacillus sp. DTU_2020_1001157_1_SI_ALB_TIR_016]|uniref:ribosome small subunit-dependent GTPase A n=1 Tax=Domibacillus sp. DTU_2020_1001157_1_SI_ALB_TIR_016 TaxID=3077789 RepID=UPI0028F08F14|nr:ribosome small subunit-dependent GTPase A [Domibacillus sp. DTU_2020_1001157_1_SI_ALB_TIR_016]WNS79766.1 ribosome small subunit-dependent GTPase A [Domibacillus sp. DTU_2020_1001157_1_SI_ALB_TIR_016]
MPEGKIIKALSGFYYVLDGEDIIQCRGRGVFRKRNITPLVGDYVEYEAENEKEGYVLSVKERKNDLVRPPVANIDQAVLVFSVMEPAFSTVLLDRFLVLIESKNIEPVICLTKMDLAEDQKMLDQYVADYRRIGYTVVETSSETMDGLHLLEGHLTEKTSVFAGQSGVGKSSLLNAIRPDLALKTDEISSSLGRGKHTTRHVELIPAAGGLVADTPGFSSLDFEGIELDELSACFPEMADRSSDCKFRGCLHLNEPKCAVKEAVAEGEIPNYRYEHYLQFIEEIKERKPRY